MSLPVPSAPARRAGSFALFGVAVAAAAALAACASDKSTGPGSGGNNTPTQGVGANAHVGDTVLFNVRTPDGTSGSACGTPTLIKSRVAAISNKAVIVVDTRNPSGGFTDAAYATIAQTFDTLVYPTDTRNFGAEQDIDGNHRVIIFYTRAVNEETPAKAGYLIEGFFASRDLFPTTKKTINGTEFDACGGSNAGELFYVLAPDVNGTVNGNVRDTAFVRRVTIGTVAHEFQHLINAERRLYVTRAPVSDEAVYLNEGLSHIAEELGFYQSSGLAVSGEPGQSPRADLTAASIRAVPNGIGALNGFQFSNLGRISEYLAAPETTSPYADNDSLNTRGATWSFLRYAADRSGGTDSAFFYSLVNSQDTGLVNLRGVIAAHGGSSAGVSLDTWFRDWAVSAYADDLVSPLAAQYTQPSWNFRSALTQFQFADHTYFNDGVYPLTTRTLANGSAQTFSLLGGASAYLRFGVAAPGGAATITASAGGAALPATARLVLVQTTGAGEGVVGTFDGPAGATISVNPGVNAGTVNYALVVFNSSGAPAQAQTFTVTGAGITAPTVSTSLASAGTGVAYSVAGGPTVARLAASSREPLMTDAPVMRRFAQSSRAELAPRVAGARAAYQEARRSGNFSAWQRQAYVPGTVRGLAVPYAGAVR